MNYRLLGKTGLEVSILSFGTAAIGMDYGIQVPNDFGKPSDEKAIDLLLKAADSGINLFDTAPTYGNSEELLGKSVSKRKDCIIATKVSLPKNPDGRPIYGKELQSLVENSVNESLKRLKRSRIDILLIHNATKEAIHQGDIILAISRLVEKGIVKFTGATVYGVENGLAVIESGLDIIQVAYNILDQRMTDAVFAAAERKKIGIIARSALLKGVLSSRANWLPTELSNLKKASLEIKNALSISLEELSRIAFRFCISSPYVATTLFGARTSNELDEALLAIQEGVLPNDVLDKVTSMRFPDDPVLDPFNWPI